MNMAIKPFFYFNELNDLPGVVRIIFRHISVMTCYFHCSSRLESQRCLQSPGCITFQTRNYAGYYVCLNKINSHLGI